MSLDEHPMAQPLNMLVHTLLVLMVAVICCLLTCKNRRPYNLYCVGGDVKPCLINQSIICCWCWVCMHLINWRIML